MSKFLIQTNIPIFQHSIIPSGLHERCSTKNAAISIGCRISETFNYSYTGELPGLIWLEMTRYGRSAQPGRQLAL